MSDKESNPKKIYSPPSELFEESFCDISSGCRRECHCGRELFDCSENSWDWEDGEFEELEKFAKEQPDKYVALPYSCGTMTIDGREFVMGCPCNGARPYQDFIDRHAEQIAKYLNARSTELAAEAEKMKVNEVDTGATQARE